MSRRRFGASLYFSLIVLMSAGTVRAATLQVNCAAKEGMHSIGSALRALQNVPGPSTINVSGACNEDVVIQGMDRVTLNAVNGASINDPSNRK